MINPYQLEPKKLIKEFSKLDKIEIPSYFPSIDEIIDCNIEIESLDNEIIETCTGYKLIIKGNKRVNLSYLNNDCSDKPICKNFIIPFYNVIQVPNSIKDINVKLNLSYCDLKLINESNIIFFNIINICLSYIDCNIKPDLVDERIKIDSNSYNLKINSYTNKKLDNYIYNSFLM